MFKLTGQRCKPEPQIIWEAPQVYHLPEAIEEASQRYFELQEEVQGVIQAHALATSDWLNLLPHLTSNLIWHAPAPSSISVIATLKGLTPFLLPTWWMDAEIAELQKKIRKDSLLRIQVDVAALIEQLFYAYERNWKIHLAHERVAKFLRDLNTDLNFNSLNLNHKKLVVNSESRLNSTWNGVRRVLEEDRYALSLALGKKKPQAFAGIRTPASN